MFLLHHSLHASNVQILLGKPKLKTTRNSSAFVLQKLKYCESPSLSRIQMRIPNGNYRGSEHNEQIQNNKCTSSQNKSTTTIVECVHVSSDSIQKLYTKEQMDEESESKDWISI